MADNISGYILDGSLTGFVYDLSVYGHAATFSVSGVSMDYVNTELNKRLKEASLGTSFIWTNGIVDVSVTSGESGATYTYVDSSLSARDTQISDVSSRLYSTDLKNASQDTSILNATIKNTNQDTSILSIWTKFGSVDTSLLNLGVKNTNQDTSILSIWTKLGSVDTSLLNLGVKNTNQDTSILNTNINFGHFIRSTSIGDHLAWNGTQLDVMDLDAYARLTYVDGSMARIKAQYIPDASLNQSKFKWIGGYLEPSIAGGSGLDRPAIDASYAIKSGFNTIFVSASQPTNPATGDLWVNIS